MVSHVLLVLSAAAWLACASGSSVASQFQTIDLSPLPLAKQIAVQTCVGLYNRNGSEVYTLGNKDDTMWLEALYPNESTPVQPDDFLAACFREKAKGYLLYNGTTQKGVLPNIITVAAVLDAVPVETAPDNATLIFDATSVFKGFSPLQATKFVFENYANHTTSLSYMNPGYTDANKHPFHPALNGTLSPGLIDYVVKVKLFNFYLVTGCIPGEEEHKFMISMLEAPTPWPRPIVVYGYDNTVRVALCNLLTFTLVSYRWRSVRGRNRLYKGPPHGTSEIGRAHV